jgi:RNA recognition motif-containing protein
LALSKISSTGLEAQPYQVREKNDISKIYNNIYIKNFNPNWTENNIKETFSRYGNIISVGLG